MAAQPGERPWAGEYGSLGDHLSWSFYPIVFIFPMIGFSGAAAATAVQVGYSVADVVAKALFGVLIYMIAVQSEHELAETRSDARLAPAE